MDQLFIHRDLKPVNILLHFPDHKNLIYLAKDDKDDLLANLDLTKTTI